MKKESQKKAKRIVLMILMIVVLAIVGVIIVEVVMNSRTADSNHEPQQETNEIVENYVDVLEDGTKLNRSSKLNEIKKVDGLEIGDIQFTYKDGIAVLLGNVKNTTSQDKGLTVIEVTLYDKNGNEIDAIEGFISPVKSGETVQLNMGVSADYANAYDFKVVKK